jgi:hypothetical protein
MYQFTHGLTFFMVIYSIHVHQFPFLIKTPVKSVQQNTGWSFCCLCIINMWSVTCQTHILGDKATLLLHLVSTINLLTRNQTDDACDTRHLMSHINEEFNYWWHDHLFVKENHHISKVNTFVDGTHLFWFFSSNVDQY